jgi:cysteine desulfurase
VIPQAPIYLDYAATTPVDARVAEKMASCLLLDGNFGNPSVTVHPYGWRAAQAVEAASAAVAQVIAAQPEELIWLSGATEADNLAIKGAARQYHKQGRHLITMSTEHHAVLDSFAQLEKEGFEVSYLDPEPNGLLDLNKLKDALRPDTTLVSVMWVNNETGVVQDIPAITRMVKANGSLMHSDAAQAVGKCELDMQKVPVDLLSMTAHKVYGPKGVGALYVRVKPRVRLVPLIHGGGQQRGLRSGTLAVHQMLAMGEAYRLAHAIMAEENGRIQRLSDRLWQGLSALGGVRLTGGDGVKVPHILNVAFEGVEGDVLIKAFPQIAVSQGAACSSASIEPSHVLQAYRLDDALAHASLRFSLGRFTTEADIQAVIALFQEKLPALRA